VVSVRIHRNSFGLIKLLFIAFKYILGRFTDPKNSKKGSWLNIEPMKINRYIQTEALEVNQAYRNNEGDERELQELGDVILFCLFRVHQIWVKHNKNI